MGRENDNLRLSGLPADVGGKIQELIEGAAEIDGAILLFDADDRVCWANDRQRALFPCCNYLHHSFPEFFWAMQSGGLLGNAAARLNPAAYLEMTMVERSTVVFGQVIYDYPAIGLTALSHRRLDNGMTLQMRHGVSPLDSASPEFVLAKAVQASRALASLTTALNCLDAGVAIVDAAGVPLFLNDAIREMTALSHDEQGALSAAWAGDVPSWRLALSAASRGDVATAALRDGAGQVAAIALMRPGTHPGDVIVLIAPLRVALSSGAAEWLAGFGVRPSEIEAIALQLLGCSTDEIGVQLGRDPKTINGQMARARGALRGRDLVVDGQHQLLTLAMQMSAITRAPWAR